MLNRGRLAKTFKSELLKCVKENVTNAELFNKLYGDIQLTVSHPFKRPIAEMTTQLKWSYAKTGRIWSDYHNLTAPAVNGIKAFKFLAVPLVNPEKGEVTLTFRFFLFTLMHVMKFAYPKISPAKLMRKSFRLLDSNGKISKAASRYFKWLHKRGNIDTIDYLQLNNLIRAFNEPEKHAYLSVSAFDAKAQNWTIFLGLFNRGIKNLSLVNINPTGNGMEIDLFDFNTRNQKLFQEAFPQYKDIILREFPKYTAMTLGYGSSYKTAIAKALHEYPEDKKEALQQFLLSVDEISIKQVLNKAIPNFANFLDFMETQLIDRNEDYYNLNIFNDIRVVGNTKKVVSVKKISKNGYETEHYSTSYTFDKEASKRFKIAYLTHVIDSSLLRHVKNIMDKTFNVNIHSNHDNFIVHPEYAWDLMDAYIYVFKSFYVFKIHLSLVQQLQIDVERFKKVVQDKKEMSEIDFLKIPDINFINHIWAV